MIRMSFTKNFYYDNDGNAQVSVAKGEPHYREQADLIFEERESDTKKFKTYRIIHASAEAQGKGFYKHDDGVNDGVKHVGDVNRVADEHPDLVIKRIDLRGEGRVVGSTNWRKTDWEGEPRGTHSFK